MEALAQTYSTDEKAVHLKTQANADSDKTTVLEKKENRAQESNFSFQFFPTRHVHGLNRTTVINQSVGHQHEPAEASCLKELYCN